jgi:hypothetical protein
MRRKVCPSHARQTINEQLNTNDTWGYKGSKFAERAEKGINVMSPCVHAKKENLQIGGIERAE